MTGRAAASGMRTFLRSDCVIILCGVVPYSKNAACHRIILKAAKPTANLPRQEYAAAQQNPDSTVSY
jgi:hypothetical protein